MKNLYALAALPLLTALLLPGCAPKKPVNFRELSKEAIKNENLLAGASQSERVITVTLDAERNVFFRKERVGTTEETALLKEKVRQAIERNKQTAPDAESFKSSSVIFMCAPANFKYQDVIGVVNALKEAGGDPIGMQTEDCAPPR
ncbi:MAG TPA: biopolymer transporter ExbD [Pyrinomonadaceae bacterium]|nr:biopolymer transporter ExbD [Pyrinomonadaceae bacterium]